ncbi:MAG: hypothetical protein NTV93_04150 [Verrucomicrobia bacterium]|nr:hypothetical protein [Verrucomicrobiota bacterium]
MKFLVVIFIIVAALWWGLKGADFLKAKPVNAEEAMAQSLSENPLSACKLGALIEKDPEMLVRLMKDSPVQISGRIKNIRVLGFENSRAEISLRATPQTEVIVVQDLDQNKLGGLQSSCRSHGLRWRLQGGQLFLGNEDGRSHVRLYGPGETYPPTSVQYQKRTGPRKIYLSSTAPVTNPFQSKSDNGSWAGKNQK